MSSEDTTEPLGDKRPEEYDTNPLLERILETVREGFAKVNVDIGTLRTEVGTLRTEVESIRSEMREGFAEVNTRLDHLEARVDKLEQRPA